MTPMEEMARGLGTGDTRTRKRGVEEGEDVAVWTQHGACPMWVSLINRVSTEFSSSRYITIPLPLSPAPLPFPLMLPPTHPLPPALPQDLVDAPGGCGERGLHATSTFASFSIAAKSISARRALCTYPRRIYSILLASAPPYRLYLGDRPY